MAACPLCSTQCDVRLLSKASELRDVITRLIRQQVPGWQPGQGICPRCAQQFALRFAARRSPTSLHTTTDPQTTFPYYDPEEETVLTQPERLADYATFDGGGTTIAFLDSGYFPHPDLTAPSGPCAQPAWDNLKLESDQARAWLTQQTTRLKFYVDLSHSGPALGLEAASLWSNSDDSWHGQMTTTLAAGNGKLSGGRFRAYAPSAQILPIKIGRADGRIPEAEILRGLQWLLHNDNWLRFGVRVLNVSVGGDFVQPWHENPVCLAAEELSRRGVLVAAAAGNSNREGLLAPAQSPSVLTVGGIDDQNRRWNDHTPHEISRLALYPHNWGRGDAGTYAIYKPELLAPARWLPSPILPVSPIFKEMHAIARCATRSSMVKRMGGTNVCRSCWTIGSTPYISTRSMPNIWPCCIVRIRLWMPR